MKPAFKAWHLSWSSIGCPTSDFFTLCGRTILFCSRSVDSWSMVFFMHWLSGWKPLIQYGHLVFSNFFFFLELEAPSKDILFSLGLELVFLVSLPLCFPLSYALFEFVIKSSWFLEVWITPIWTNLSCSCIKDSTKGSREGIFQLGTEALLEWNVETKTWVLWDKIS